MKLKRPLVVFDLETTGVDVANDRIVQFGAVKIGKNGRPGKEFETLINPEQLIPPEVIEIHGITDADVADEPPFRVVAGEIYSFFDGCDIGGYNCIRFDTPMLRNEFKRCGYDWPAPGTEQLDAMRIFKRQERHSLEKAVKFYAKREHKGAHDAVVDVYATIDVLKGQSKLYKAKTLEALLELSRDPNSYDDEGKLKWVDDKLVLNFGQYAGMTLSDVRFKDGGYFDWILRKDFSEQVKEVIRHYQAGGTVERE